MCSAAYFGEMVTGRPVASAISSVGTSRPFECRSSPTRRPDSTAPSSTVLQKSQLRSGTPLSPWVRIVNPPIAGQASSRAWSASRQYAA